MILPTFTLEEISNEIQKDQRALSAFQDSIKPKFKRATLKATRYPLTCAYKYTSPSRNQYTTILTAFRRGQHSTPWANSFVQYTHEGGRTVVVFAQDGDKCDYTLFTSHFWKRYRERVVKSDISQDEIILEFFKRNICVSYIKTDLFFPENSEIVHRDDCDYGIIVSLDGMIIYERELAHPHFFVARTIVPVHDLFNFQQSNFMQEYIKLWFEQMAQTHNRFETQIMAVLQTLAEEVRRTNDGDKIKLLTLDAINTVLEICGEKQS